MSRKKVSTKESHPINHPIKQSLPLISRSIFLRIICLVHTDSQEIRRAAGQSQTPANLLVGIDILDLIEALQQTNEYVSSLGEGELLSNTDTWPTVEWNILPASLAVQPAIGLELIRVRTPEILATVHNMGAVHDGLALLDIYWGLAVRATATRDGSIAGGGAAVEGDNGEQAEGLIHAVLQVLAGFEGGEGDVLRVGIGAEVLDDGLAQLLEGIWVPCEHHDGPAEQGGSSVTASEEDVEELRAQFDRVTGNGEKGFQEDVVLIFLLVDGTLAAVYGFESIAHDAVHKVVHLFIRVSSFLVVYDEGELLEAAALGTDPLGLVKVVCERVFGTLQPLERTQLAFHAFAKQELGSGIDGQTEEDGLEIGRSRPTIRSNG